MDDLIKKGNIIRFLKIAITIWFGIRKIVSYAMEAKKYNDKRKTSGRCIKEVEGMKNMEIWDGNAQQSEEKNRIN